MFQGVTLFLSALLALGSSSAIANMVSGVILIYTRAFRIGDRTEIKMTQTGQKPEVKTLSSSEILIDGKSLEVVLKEISDGVKNNSAKLDKLERFDEKFDNY